MKKPISAAAFAGSVALLTACGASPGAENAMTFVSWGGDGQALQEQYWTDPFAEQNGITVVQDSPTDYAKLQAMVQSGNVSWDVVQVATDVAVAKCGELLEPIDRTVVDMSQIDPDLIFSDCGLPVLQQSFVMVYNEDLFGNNPPTSIADFFDTAKYPGKRGMWDYAVPGQLELALMADGVAPENLYPLDYERAMAKLATLRNDVSWYGTTAQSTEQLNSGGVAMALVYSGRAHTAAKDGAPYAPVWNTAMRATDQLTIPKGAPNKEAAQKFLSYIATPAPQEQLAEAVPYAPTVEGSSVELDELGRKFSATESGHLDDTHIVDMKWWSENNDRVDQAWLTWQAG
ncbi:ABC transporter substrate-binding protein [Rhodococcus koreensis]|uniref:ABC transporter substrate-binding protein n=1 Tax=Rhodococcus TaxID=1827 RepID=UPI0010E9DD8F|nr:ABC transporter substrate-binding protein [Rhodococcus koreensis]NHU45555.1 ABC transporter substrate-binding protein [Rhodococcus sp. A14]QSE85816.1 ABC transporter substrate-binding protein [Rhodococcus koreensis]RYF60384.1 MAG: ABC transporter substrate-binding protein [Comamonadaceae bacterium]